ncbi:MAG TPA: SDR family NAD(P)-dependent oxidoreductase, partial [Usitatibacter sp.]
MTGSSFAPMERLDGRNVLIAGGLGAVGRACAMRFAALGARIVVLHRHPDEEAASFIKSLAGSGHMAVNASITESASLVRAAQSVKEKLGVLHVLVNTAGFTKPVAAGDLDALTDDLIDSIFAANWRGVFAT